MKAITAWLALPEKARGDFIAWARKGGRDATARKLAGLALEELPELRTPTQVLTETKKRLKQRNITPDWHANFGPLCSTKCPQCVEDFTQTPPGFACKVTCLVVNQQLCGPAVASLVKTCASDCTPEPGK